MFKRVDISMNFVVILNLTQKSNELTVTLNLNSVQNKELQIIDVQHIDDVVKLKTRVPLETDNKILIIYPKLEDIILDSLIDCNKLDVDKVANYKDIIYQILNLQKANRKNIGLVEISGLCEQQYKLHNNNFKEIVSLIQNTQLQKYSAEHENEQWLIQQYVKSDIEFAEIYAELQAASIALGASNFDSLNLEALLINYFQTKNDLRSLSKLTQTKSQENELLSLEIELLTKKHKEAIEQLKQTQIELNDNAQIKLLSEENTLLLNELFRLQEGYFVEHQKSADTNNKSKSIIANPIITRDIISRYHELNNIQSCLELCIYSHRVNLKSSIKEYFNRARILDKVQLSTIQFNKFTEAYDLQIEYKQYQIFYNNLINQGVYAVKVSLDNFTGDSVKKAKIYLTLALAFKDVDFSVAHNLAYLGFNGYINSFLQKKGIAAILDKIKGLSTESKLKGIYLIQIARLLHDDDKDTVALEAKLIKEAINIDQSADTLVGAYWASKKIAQLALVKQVLELLNGVTDKNSGVETAIVSANKYLKNAK